MADIIIVRHGQTEWNRIERFRGRRDLELNETGLEQVERVAKRLALEHRVAVVLASPLKRTLQTAAPIVRATGAELSVRDELVDIDYGAWEGLTPEEAERGFPDLYRTWLDQPQNMVFPGGEGLPDVRVRVARILQEVATSRPGDAVVLVSHKVPCKLLLCVALGIDNSHFWQIEQDNGAISLVMPWEDGFTVRFMNDTCHLGA